MLQNNNSCCVCEVIFWDQYETLTKHRLHNKNVVYLISCNSCLLNKRMNGHRGLDLKGPQYHTSVRSNHTKKLRESFWIRRLHTLAPFGIKQGN